MVNDSLIRAALSHWSLHVTAIGYRDDTVTAQTSLHFDLTDESHEKFHTGLHLMHAVSHAITDFPAILNSNPTYLLSVLKFTLIVYLNKCD